MSQVSMIVINKIQKLNGSFVEHISHKLNAHACACAYVSISAWAVAGLWLGCGWAVAGLCLGCAWAAGLCLGCALAVPWLCLGCALAVPWLCLGCTYALLTINHFR
jgi:hypothetical protein